jgi:hypothetical protein
MKIISSTTSLAFFPLFILLSGCSGSNGERLETAKVTGTVTYRSSPVVGATVIFTNSTSGPAGTALTNSEGKYSLTTYETADGAIPGDYIITVSKTIAPVAEKTGDGSMESAVASAKKKKKAGNATGSTSVLPQKYADPGKSGLTFKVEAGKENEFPIELKD